MNKPLTGSTAIVTGGASGIGWACAERLAAEGAALVLIDKDPTVVARAGELGAIGRACDITSANDVASALADLATIDVLVNCAGITRPRKHFRDECPATWDEVMAVNVSGMYYCCQAVMGRMRAAGSGTIINVSSWAGRYPAYFTGAAYNASKRAVIALSDSINLEEGLHGIRATTIMPEEVDTPMLARRKTPPTALERERMLRPSDVASLVATVAMLPDRVCVNELIVSPTWNRSFFGTYPNASSDRADLAGAS